MAGTMDGGGGRRAGTIAGINVTPLVDVVLVLLIILMVSSTYIVAQTLKVQLPKARSTDGTADKPHTIAVLKNGTLTWDEAPVNEDQAVKNMKEAVAADPDFSLVVSADKEVQHGRVVHVLDIAKLAGVVKFAINVQQEN
jgi:biopolymer transport protein ExbD